MLSQQEQSSLDDIRVFHAVVKASGFTAASRVLGTPKSTLSRRVARLEDELGVLLLTRTTRRIQLTEAGASYFEASRRALDELEDARRAIVEQQTIPRGRLRVTAPVDLGVAFLGDIVTDFMQAYPQVELAIDLSSRVVDLRGEGYDVAIRAGELRDEGLYARKVATDRMRLFASPAYLQRRGHPRSMAGLAQHDRIIAGPPAAATWPLSYRGKDHQLPPEARLRATDFGFARRAAVAGAGIAYLPSVICFDDVTRGRLVNVLPGACGPATPLWVVYSSRRAPAKTRVFVEFIAESLGPALSRWSS